MIVLSGPTASGKTALSFGICKLLKDKGLDPIIINADAFQIYKDLYVSTATPHPDEVNEDHWVINGFKHFLFGFIEFDKEYSIYNYQRDFQKILQDNPNSTPVIVGGSGLYIDSIVYKYELNDSELSAQSSELNDLNIDELSTLVPSPILEKLNNSDRKNPRRLINIIINQKRSEANDRSKIDPSILYLYLSLEQEDINSNIETRTSEMFNDNKIEEELKRLISHKNFTWDLQVSKAVGISEFQKYFNDQMKIDEVQETIVKNTIRLSKKQRKWFKRNPHIINVNNFGDIEKEIDNFLPIS